MKATITHDERFRIIIRMAIVGLAIGLAALATAKMEPFWITRNLFILFAIVQVSTCALCLRGFWICTQEIERLRK